MSYSLLLGPDGAQRTDMVRRDEDGATIPADPRNADWRAYQAWLTAGNAPASPPPAAPAPSPDLSDRQFARGLWGDGIIPYGDFLAFIGPGSIPAAIQAILNTLPDDESGAPTPRKEAIGFLTGSQAYVFTHPLVETFRQALVATDPKWTPEYLRERWAIWATL